MIFILAGTRHENYDDSRSTMMATSSSSPLGDTRSLDEGALLGTGGPIMSESRVMSGASDILALLGILGEAYRLSCLYRCQVLMISDRDFCKYFTYFKLLPFEITNSLRSKQDSLDVYLKLPHKHYNTGWVLAQVIPSDCFQFSFIDFCCFLLYKFIIFGMWDLIILKDDRTECNVNRRIFSLVSVLCDPISLLIAYLEKDEPGLVERKIYMKFLYC